MTGRKFALKDISGNVFLVTGQVLVVNVSHLYFPMYIHYKRRLEQGDGRAQVLVLGI